MKVITLLFALYSLSVNLFALQSAESCPSYDFTNHFSDKRDQGSGGLCWAFAGSGLVEEYLCLEDKKNCGKQVSVIDGQRCIWSKDRGLGTRQTGVPATSMFTMCALRYGVCSEKEAPFRVSDAFGSQADNNRAVYKAFMETLKLKIHYNISPKNNCDIAQLEKDHKLDAFFKSFGKVVEKLSDQLADDFENLKIDYFNALLTKSHYTDAMRGVFITESCKKDRQFPKNREVKPYFTLVKGMSAQKKFNYLLTSFKKGRSSTLGLCGQRARKRRYEDLLFFEKFGTSKEDYQKEIEQTRCGQHSVVVNGIRFKNGRCQIHVRNSWPIGSGLEDWVDAETVLNQTLTIEHIDTKKNPD